MHKGFPFYAWDQKIKSPLSLPNIYFKCRSRNLLTEHQRYIIIGIHQKFLLYDLSKHVLVFVTKSYFDNFKEPHTSPIVDSSTGDFFLPSSFFLPHVNLCWRALSKYNMPHSFFKVASKRTLNQSSFADRSLQFFVLQTPSINRIDINSKRDVSGYSALQNCDW